MSVTAGRVFLALTFAAFIGGGGWLLLAPPWSTAALVAATLGLLGLVGFVVGMAVLPPFVEARIEPGRRIEIRRVLGRRQVVRAGDLDEIVLLEQLRQPSRGGPTTVVRVVLRSGGRTVAAFTPRHHGLSAELERLGVPLTVVADPIDPREARRRYPGSTTALEAATLALSCLAIIVPVLVVAWLVLDAR